MFLGSGGGVYVVDVSAPQNPIKVSNRIYTHDIVEDLFLDDVAHLLYIAANYAGLAIWDVSDPVNPERLGHYKPPGVVTGVYTVDSFAYVTSDDIFRVIDVSTPQEPREIGNCTPGGNPVSICVSGLYAYLAANDGGLVIVDISVPTNPHTVGSCFIGLEALDASVSGSYAYIAGERYYDSASVSIIDVSDPTNPYETGRLVLESDGWVVYDCALQIRDSLVYFSSGLWGVDPFRIINVSNPNDPHEIGSYDLRGNSIKVAGDYAYLSSGNILDVSNPQDPQFIGQYELPSKAHDVHVSGSHAYLTETSGYLRILDISDPTYPVEVGHLADRRRVGSIDVVGDYAYFPYKRGQYDTAHLAVVDISVPSNPVQVGDCARSYPHEGEVCGIHVVGSHAFIALRNWWTGGKGGLWIVDISNPSDPYEVGFFDPYRQSYSFDVYVVDTLAYFASHDLYILDVSDATQPVEVGYCTLSSWPSGVYVANAFAYTASASGLLSIDVSDPTHPQEVGRCNTPYYAKRIHVSENLAYLVARNGLRIIDVSVPDDPQEVGFYNDGRGRSGVHVLGRHIFTTRGNGLTIYQNLLTAVKDDINAGIYPSVLQCPNPVTGDFIKFSVHIKNSANVDVCLYNALGQLVRKLSLEHHASGEHKVSISTRDIPGGVYFLSLESEDYTDTRKLVLLK
jgi:hypothetical protein